MKTRILIIIACVMMLVPLQTIYAPPETDPMDAFEFSDYVITGKVISSKITPDPREDTPQVKYRDKVEYEIQVLTWHKNHIEDNVITVYGKHYPNDVVPEPMWGVVEFEIGDKVYLYLDQTDDGLKFREYGSYLIEPEPEQDKIIPDNCGPGTTLQDGICVVNPENDDISTSVKWGDAYDELPSPDLEPIRDYDYGFIYVIILLTVVIIGGVVGGIVFVIRRKRK
ncbi:MAG: hypothetical protein PVI88_02390 [Nitrosopumilaceae archaeon]